VGAVLVTGMSGAGKSTALATLADRGHRTVDTDEGDWIEVRDGERLWRADRVTALLDRHRDGPLFVSGTVANQGEWYPRFDAVVLLTAPLEVLLARVATRTTNGFGRAPGERRRIVEDTTVVEPLLRRRATAVIDTRAPLEEVVDALLRAAGVTPGGR
jgi:adenylate kinase family enzyme